MQLVNTFVPVVVVVLGYGIESAGLALLLGTFCVNLLLINDALALCRRYRIALNRPSWDVGLRNLYHSLVVSLSAVCDLLRAQGVRLLLAPLGGAREVAAFSITRTGANLALQGIATITQPLMPELLSFVRARDQVRVESAFALVWLILLSIVNPAVLLLQWLGSPIFSIWTRGKVAFDPLLFAFLISDILIFALAQPAMAVVQGNNLTRIQFKTSLFSGILTLIGIYFSMQVAGIRGAAAVLAMVEIVVLTVYVFVAWKWFADVRMRWPWSSFAVVLFSVAITIAALLCMAAGGPIWIWMAVAIVLQYIAVYHYYSRLPEIGKRRLAKLISAPITLLRRNSQRQSPLL